MVNLLLYYLYDDLIVGDHAENPSEGAISCYKYPKVAIELSNFIIREKALRHISISWSPQVKIEPIFVTG
jgi:hypothetical protein